MTDSPIAMISAGMMVQEMVTPGRRKVVEAEKRPVLAEGTVSAGVIGCTWVVVVMETYIVWETDRVHSTNTYLQENAYAVEELLSQQKHRSYCQDQCTGYPYIIRCAQWLLVLTDTLGKPPGGNGVYFCCTCIWQTGRIARKQLAPCDPNLGSANVLFPCVIRCLILFA